MHEHGTVQLGALSLVVLDLALSISDVRLGVRSFDSWSRSEVLDSLSCSGSSEDESVLSSRVLECQLVESADGASSSEDSLSCTFSNSESNDVKLWYIDESVVIGHGSHTDSSNVILAFHVLGNSGNGDWCSSSVAVLEESKDSEVELVLGSSGEEGIQLQVTFLP